MYKKILWFVGRVLKIIQNHEDKQEKLRNLLLEVAKELKDPYMIKYYSEVNGPDTSSKIDFTISKREELHVPK